MGSRLLPLLYLRTDIFDCVTAQANAALLLGCAYEAWAVRELSGLKSTALFGPIIIGRHNGFKLLFCSPARAVSHRRVFFGAQCAIFSADCSSSLLPQPVQKMVFAEDDPLE